MENKPVFQLHHSMMNTYNLIVGNNSLKEIEESPYPYLIKFRNPVTSKDVIDAVFSYFEKLECYEMCQELIKNADVWMRIELNTCTCENPIYHRVYKVRPPKCVRCNKSVYIPKS